LPNSLSFNRYNPGTSEVGEKEAGAGNATPLLDADKEAANPLIEPRRHSCSKTWSKINSGDKKWTH